MSEAFLIYGYFLENEFSKKDDNFGICKESANQMKKNNRTSMWLSEGCDTPEQLVCEKSPSAGFLKVSNKLMFHENTNSIMFTSSISIRAGQSYWGN